MTVVFRRPIQFISYMYGNSGTSSKTFGDIMDEHVTHTDVRQLITMITEGTTSAAPAEIDATYMLRAFHEMWSQQTTLQYPAVCYLPQLLHIASWELSSELTEIGAVQYQLTPLEFGILLALLFR